MNLNNPQKECGVKAARRPRYFTTRMITKIAILAALSTVAMLLEVPLGFAPPFYKLDLSELFVMLGGFSLGPMAAALIELIKVLLNLLINGTETACVGEFANFLIGCALVVPASMIFKKMPDGKGAVIGCAVGTVVLTVVGSVLNAFLLLPTYAYFYGMPMDALIAMGTAVNAKIADLSTFVLFAVAPFNLVKGCVVSGIICLLYRRLVPLLQR